MLAYGVFVGDRLAYDLTARAISVLPCVAPSGSKLYPLDAEYKLSKTLHFLGTIDKYKSYGVSPMGQCCCCGGYKPSEDEDTTLPNTLPNLEEKPAETPYPVMASYDKTFTIYTSTTDPRKILKHQTQVCIITITAVELY